MSSKARQKEKQRNRANNLYKQLMGKYKVMRLYRTLEVGIKPKLIEAIHNNELFAENSVYIIEMCLKKYTSSSNYLQNALKFKSRFDLDNNKVGNISAKDLVYFDKELKAHNKRKVINIENKANEEAHRVRRKVRRRRPVLSLNRSSVD